MRRIALIVLLVPLALIVVACGNKEEEARNAPVYTQGDAGTEIPISKGGFFVIELETNTSTGYEWSYKAPAGITMAAFEMLPPADGAEDMVGQPQPYRWTFEVEDAQNGTLVFENTPPGGDAPETTLEFPLVAN